MKPTYEKSSKPHHWLRIWLLTPFLIGLALFANETLLKVARHEPSIVSDADLFCTAYSKVNKLNQNDVVFLGASRTQTGIDLAVVEKQTPARTALMLAQSGRGTSFPVLSKIVEDTEFKGTIVIDETEQSLISQAQEQQLFVESCSNFSLNRWSNRQIATILQSSFMFINPQSSSFRLWGNILVDHELPEPFYTKTLPDRQQLVDYSRADPTALRLLAQNRLKGVKMGVKSRLTPSDWLLQTQHWQPLIQKFQRRGGTIIFVRMPVSRNRWYFEAKTYPPSRYWDVFIEKNNVNSIHFSEFPELSSFELADTSHLGFQHKAQFTKFLVGAFDEAHGLSFERLVNEIEPDS